MAAVAEAVTVDRRKGPLWDPVQVPPIVVSDCGAWAEWKRLDRRGYWGGGGGSPIWALMQQKKTGIHSTGTAIEPEMTGNVLAVDRAVSQLEPWAYAAFWAHWVDYSTVEAKARRCACTVGTFYVWLELAMIDVATYVTRWRKSA